MAGFYVSCALNRKVDSRTITVVRETLDNSIHAMNDLINYVTRREKAALFEAKDSLYEMQDLLDKCKADFPSSGKYPRVKP